MLIKSKFFGEIEIDDMDIITFEEGIPGFSDLHRYAILSDNENTSINYLQSLEKENICFIMMPPILIEKDYEIEISESSEKKLEIENPGDLSLFAILTIPGSFKDTTVNLKAPIIINKKNNKGIQEILDDERYNIRHRIVKESDV